jgi:hypothetical protein
MKVSSDKKKGNPKGDKKRGESKFGSKSFKPKKKELKFMPLDIKSQVAQASYNTVKEALITKIAATFEKGRQDVMVSLEDEAKVVPVVPTLGVSTKSGDNEKKENTEFTYIYCDKIKRYNYRIDILDDGLVKAYGLIWSHAVTLMSSGHGGERARFALKSSKIFSKDVLRTITTKISVRSSYYNLYCI